MKPAEDTAKLIDMELVKVLELCQELFLKYKHNNEEYQEEIMVKSIELGKKTK